MATIFKEILVDARPDDVWSAVRNVGEVKRMVPGLITDSHLDGDSRVVTFANGAVVRELIVSVDENLRRVVYAITESPFNATHHNASMQVFENGGGSRVVWITDVVPDALLPTVSGIVDQASDIFKQTMDSQVAPK